LQTPAATQPLVNPRAIVRPTDGYSVAKARTRLRRPILLITVDRRGTLTPARPAVKSGAVDHRQHRPRTLAGSVAPPACNCVRASDIYRQRRNPQVDSDTRIVGLALVTSAAPHWTICACAGLLFRSEERQYSAVWSIPWDGPPRLNARPLVASRDLVAQLTVGFRLIAGAELAQPPGLSPAGRCPMTTAAPSTALATIQPAFTDAERVALAGFLAGYRGLTREAYALDLRQFASWCRAQSLALFAVRRADIEGFARDLEAMGRARATATRRLSTIAGFYKYAVEEELLERSPAAHVRRPRVDYESHAVALDRNELGALLVAAGLGSSAGHALIPLLALNGLRVSEATG